MTEIERTWWATLSTDERSTVRVSGHLGQAFRTQDRAALRRVLAPDFVAVGHGEFGLEQVDREQYLTSHQGRTDLFGASRQVYDVIELPSPAVMVVRSAVDTAPERTKRGSRHLERHPRPR